MVSECTTFIQACKEAQVKCIVKCTQGAVDAELCHHQLAEWNHQIEELLRNSGIPYHQLSILKQITFLLLLLNTS